MPTFKELIKSKAIEDRLPFGIEFEITPDFNGVPTESVAGLNIPVFNELLVQESWFFEILEEATGNRRAELGSMYRALILEFKKFMQYGSYKEANENLFVPSEQLQEDPLYQEFVSLHAEDFNKIVDLVALMNNDKIASWMRVAFFLASRVGEEWTDLGRTARLRVSQIKAINDFILKESNGGVMPKPEMEPESEEPMGNEFSPEAIEPATTGKSKR
jgi:hypothetical protein